MSKDQIACRLGVLPGYEARVANVGRGAPAPPVVFQAPWLARADSSRLVSAALAVALLGGLFFASSRVRMQACAHVVGVFSPTVAIIGMLLFIAAFLVDARKNRSPRFRI